MITTKNIMGDKFDEIDALEFIHIDNGTSEIVNVYDHMITATRASMKVSGTSLNKGGFELLEICSRGEFRVT